MTQAEDDDREVMDVRGAAPYLGISQDTLYTYAQAGTVPAFRLGNRWHFRRTRLNQWMDELAAQIPPKQVEP